MKLHKRAAMLSELWFDKWAGLSPPQSAGSNVCKVLEDDVWWYLHSHLTAKLVPNEAAG